MELATEEERYHGFSQRWKELSYHEAGMIVFGINLVFLVSYWSTCLAFLYVDMCGRPRWMLRYKIQPGKNQPPKKEDVIRLMKQSTINYFLVALPYTVLHYVLHKLRGSDVTFKLASIGEFVLHIIGCIVLGEITFYYSHRLLHSQYLYKTVHWIHHEWTSPIGLAALYSHPIEFAFCTIGTLSSGPIVMGSCHVTVLVWISLATVNTIISHSGYHLPFMPSTEFHNYHHLKFVNNYGFLGILDRLHNTYDPTFLKSTQ